jgi:hypothetical protein
MAMSEWRPVTAGPEDFPEDVQDRVRAMIAEGKPILFEEVFAGYSYEEMQEEARKLGDRIADRMQERQ